MSKYSEKLKDPRWQKKRLEIFERDKFMCQHCGDTKSTLHVHHLRYQTGKEPWEYDSEDMMTLCGGCHEIEYLHRKESEDNLLLSLRKAGFCCDELGLLSVYVLDHTEELKHYIFEDEWKEIQKFIEKREVENGNSIS